MAKRSRYAKALDKIQAQQKDLARWWARRKRSPHDTVEIVRGSLDVLRGVGLQHRRAKYLPQPDNLEEALADADDALGADTLGYEDEDEGDGDET